MTDVFDKEKRSKIMAANKGRGNKSTEVRMEQMLLEAGITGWRKNATDVKGKPDFVFDDLQMAIFVDGCFWHGCLECRNIPATNTEFWEKKIGRTVERDKENTRLLTENGWTVLRFWEHELKKQKEQCLEKIQSKVASLWIQLNGNIE